MTKPTTPKPESEKRKSAAPRRRKQPKRLRSWGCAPKKSDKLVEKKRSYFNGGLRMPSTKMRALPLPNWTERAEEITGGQS